MATREQRIYQEAAALWRELYSKPPPAGLDGAAILKLITSGSEPPRYTQLASPHLRNVVRRA
jgi:hypothetical protein